METLAELPSTGDQAVCLGHDQAAWTDLHQQGGPAQDQWRIFGAAQRVILWFEAFWRQACELTTFPLPSVSRLIAILSTTTRPRSR
jgi:hypothetical protein